MSGPDFDGFTTGKHLTALQICNRCLYRKNENQSGQKWTESHL